MLQIMVFQLQLFVVFPADGILFHFHLMQMLHVKHIVFQSQRPLHRKQNKQRQQTAGNRITGHSDSCQGIFHMTDPVKPHQTDTDGNDYHADSGQKRIFLNGIAVTGKLPSQKQPDYEIKYTSYQKIQWRTVFNRDPWIHKQQHIQMIGNMLNGNTRHAGCDHFNCTHPITDIHTENTAGNYRQTAKKRRKAVILSKFGHNQAAHRQQHH